MTLTPVKPRFRTSAEAQIYAAIEKMDLETAELYCKMVLFDVVNKDIDANFEVLQKHLDEVVDAQIEKAERAIVKRYREEGASPELAKMAEALDELSKADDEKRWEPKLHPRNSKGQFTFKVRSSKHFKPLKGGDEQRAGIENPHRRLTREQRAEYQQEYMQVAHLLQSARQAGFHDNDAELLLRNKFTGEVTTQLKPDTTLKGSEWNPRTQNVVGVRLTHQGESLSAKGATFDIMTAMGAEPQTGARAGEGVEGVTGYLKSGNDGFASQWNDSGAENESNRLLYNRIGAGSKFLGAAMPHSDKARLASTVGGVVRDYAPEAEKVFGPPSRKNMYRYRGTERPIDTIIQREANVQGEDNLPGRRGVYLRYLASRLPSRELAQLQLESGVTPPSEGIMISRDGQPVTQAVGYGDDHYLPFNLKNLKKLKGGEYIRTRSVGGPTSEDIYTGLMAGARQVTVVSRSGVFTVEFNEDFRGGRRYNQKAYRMVNRYERLVDSLNSGRVVRSGVGPEERRAIQAEVENESHGVRSPGEVQAEVQRRVNQRLETNAFSMDDWKELDERYRQFELNQGEAPSAARAKREKEEIYLEMLDEKASLWSLNGTGYAGALRALQEQFPYYIKRTNWVAKPEAEKGRVHPDWDKGPIIGEPTQGKDTGLVEHTRNRPTSARGNFHSAFAGGGAAVSAANYDYQGRGKLVSMPKEDEKQTATSTGAASGSGAATPASTPVARSEASGVELVAAADKVRKLLAPLRNYNGENPEYAPFPGVKDTDEEFKARMADPVKRDEFLSELSAQAHNLGTTVEGFAQAHSDLKRAAGKFGQEEYDPSKHRLNVSDYPYFYSFPQGDEQEFLRQFRAQPLLTGKVYDEMTDDDFKAELMEAKKNHGILVTALGIDNDKPLSERKGAMISSVTDDRGAVGHPAVRDSLARGEIVPMNTYIDSVQLARHLKTKETESGVSPNPKAGKLQEQLRLGLITEEEYRALTQEPEDLQKSARMTSERFLSLGWELLDQLR